MQPGRLRFALRSVLLPIFLLILTACVQSVVQDVPTPQFTAIPQTEEPTPTINWFPATATPTPLQAIQPTPTSVAFDPQQYLGVILYEDDFSDSTRWETGKTASGNVVYGDGRLSLAVAGNKGSLTSLSPYTLPADFYLEMTANVSLCQYGDQYGILFWYLSSGDTYRLSLTCDGRLRLELIAGNGGAVLQDWTYARKMIPGSPAEQKIGLWAKVGEIRVFVNGAEQFSLKTGPGRTGRLGVFARAAGETAMTVSFSDLAVYQIENEP